MAFLLQENIPSFWGSKGFFWLQSNYVKLTLPVGVLWGERIEQLWTAGLLVISLIDVKVAGIITVFCDFLCGPTSIYLCLVIFNCICFNHHYWVSLNFLVSPMSILYWSCCSCQWACGKAVTLSFASPLRPLKTESGHQGSMGGCFAQKMARTPILGSTIHPDIFPSSSCTCAGWHSPSGSYATQHGIRCPSTLMWQKRWDAQWVSGTSKKYQFDRWLPCNHNW